jgi:hypothetical protein
MLDKNLASGSKPSRNDEYPKSQTAPLHVDGGPRPEARYVFKEDEEAGLPYYRRWRKRGKRLLRRGVRGLRLQVRFGGELLAELLRACLSRN